MRTFTKVLAGSAAAVALAAFAPAASAAVYILPWTAVPDGGISLNFGDNAIGSADQATAVYLASPATGTLATPADGTGSHSTTGGEWTDSFSFTLPTGVVGFSLTSIGFVASADAFFDTATFNGAGLTITNTPIGGAGSNMALAFDGPQPIFLAGPQTLVITGHGGANASYAGVGTFNPIPEPATWGLMIMGFGGIGAMVRNRRRQGVFA